MKLKIVEKGKKLVNSKFYVAYGFKKLHKYTIKLKKTFVCSYIYFDCGVSSAVKDLTGVYFLDDHSESLNLEK